MKLGFDAKRYFHNASGLGNYSRDLVHALQSLYPENRYFLFDAKPLTLDLPPNTIAAVPQSPGFFWRIKGIMREIKLYGLDIYHGLSNELPFGKWPAGVKKVVTVHDVIFRRYPGHYSLPDRIIYHFKTRHALKVADAVVATSKATAADIIEYYHADPGRISVIYQTCGEAHRKSYSVHETEQFRLKRRLPADFILYVSSFQVRKNHLSLLSALERLNDKNIRLVLAGRKGETMDSCLKFIASKGLQDKVTILSDIPETELPLLYRCAKAFIYPSVAEGFGIPLLEAANAGLPVAVNDIPVFRELVPDLGLVFDADNIDDTASMLLKLSGESPKDHSEFLKQFSPEVCAAQMHGLYTSLTAKS